MVSQILIFCCHCFEKPIVGVGVPDDPTAKRQFGTFPKMLRIFRGTSRTPSPTI